MRILECFRFNHDSNGFPFFVQWKHVFFEFESHLKEWLNDQKCNFSSNIIEGCLFGEWTSTFPRVRVHRTGAYAHKRAILI